MSTDTQVDPKALPQARTYTREDIDRIKATYACEREKHLGAVVAAARICGLFEPKTRDGMPNPQRATTLTVFWSRTPHGLLLLSAESDTGAKAELFATGYGNP